MLFLRYSYAHRLDSWRSRPFGLGWIPHKQIMTVQHVLVFRLSGALHGGKSGQECRWSALQSYLTRWYVVSALPFRIPTWWLDEWDVCQENHCIQLEFEYKIERDRERKSFLSKTQQLSVRHQALANTPKSNTWWIRKAFKSFETYWSAIKFVSHSQTLQGRISALCLPETCLWLLWYSTLNESCLMVIMGSRLHPQTLTPSSGCRQNYIFFESRPTTQTNLVISPSKMSAHFSVVMSGKSCWLNLMSGCSSLV